MLFLKNILFIFIYFWLCWSSFLHRLFSSCGEQELLSSCGVQASYCGDFFCCRTQLQGAWVSIVVAHGLNSCSSQALEHKLNSWDSWTQLPCSMWDIPGLGIEPVSPALTGGFFTTEPPGKPAIEDLNCMQRYTCLQLLFTVCWPNQSHGSNLFFEN